MTNSDNPGAAASQMTLTDAQQSAAEMLQSCERAAASQRAYLHRLRDELRVLEEVLPQKRAAVDRAAKDYDDARALLSESFSLYRDLMGMTDSEAAAVLP